MKIFLPCVDTCADSMDITSKEHEISLLFCSILAQEKANPNPQFKGCFSPSFQKKIYDAIIETMNNEWASKRPEEIMNSIEAVAKVHSALELQGEHISDKLDVYSSLFELARYLNDENEVYVVTNYPQKCGAERQKWLASLTDGYSTQFPIITPGQAIYLTRAK